MFTDAVVKDEDEFISKSEAGRRWGVVPSAVTKYLVAGMPVADGGRLNWAEAERWRRDYVAPEKSGSYQSRFRAGRIKGQETKAARKAADDGFDIVREMQNDGFLLGFACARANPDEHLPDWVIGDPSNREVAMRVLGRVRAWIADLDPNGVH